MRVRSTTMATSPRPRLEARRCLAVVATTTLLILASTPPLAHASREEALEVAPDALLFGEGAADLGYEGEDLAPDAFFEATANHHHHAAAGAAAHDLRALLQAASPPTNDDNGPIVFGQSCALTGNNAAVGIGMRDGILAAFREANAAGGVYGRKLELITYDDMYEPEPAANNTRTLIERDKVFALIGEVGTPTSKVAQPIASEFGVPFIAPFTGAMFLRKPWKDASDVINVRASYNDETAAMIEYFVREKKMSRISVFYQNDSFGGAGLDGVKSALESVSLPTYSLGTYSRNTDDIGPGFNAVFSKKSPPQAIVMVGTYKQLAMFVAKAKKEYPDADLYFSTVSFVGPAAFAGALASQEGGTDNFENVLVTQVVPLPDNDEELAVRYRRSLAEEAPDSKPDFVSMEGYMAGMLVYNSLMGMDSQAVNANSGQALLDDIYESGIIDIDGWRLGPYGGNCSQLSTGCLCNQGMREVFLTQITQEGRYRLVPDFTFQFSTCGFEPEKKEPFVLGQTATLSGEGGHVGLGLQMGVQAAFQEFNLQGGVQGHQLLLNSLDDESDPGTASENTQRLIEDDKVMGMVASVGDEATEAVLSVSERLAVPLIGPFTGSMSFRKPFSKHVINLYPSVVDEISALANYAVVKELKSLSVVYFGNPALGPSLQVKSEANHNATFDQIEQILKTQGIQLKGVQMFQPNANDGIGPLVEDVLGSDNAPDGIMLVGGDSSEAKVAFIQYAHETYPKKAQSYYVAQEYAAQEGLDDLPSDLQNAVVFSSILPSVQGNELITSHFEKALEDFDPDAIPDTYSYAGYVAGRFIGAVLQTTASTIVADGISFESKIEMFTKAVFQTETFPLDGLTLGPFKDRPCSVYGPSLDSNADEGEFCARAALLTPPPPPFRAKVSQCPFPLLHLLTRSSTQIHRYKLGMTSVLATRVRTTSST